MEPEILDSKIVSQNGPYLRIKRWLRGIHPERGIIVKGLTGFETIEEKDVFRPEHRFNVVEPPK